VGEAPIEKLTHIYNSNRFAIFDRCEMHLNLVDQHLTPAEIDTQVAGSEALASILAPPRGKVGR
jgi:hypothetical protein